MKNKKLIVLQGVPSSGKTTWSKKEVKEKKDYFRVSKDELRAMMPEPWSRKYELKISNLERTMVEGAIKNGKNIIVDNTHLLLKRGRHNLHIEFYSELAKKYNMDFQVKTFHIDMEEAIERDSKRGEKSVGRKVFEEIVKKRVVPGKFSANPIFKEPNKNLDTAIICDLDGTLAFMNGKRSPYDYSKVVGDDINGPLHDMLLILENAGIEIIFVSGREDGCRKETQAWLNKWDFGDSKLLMRKHGDVRCDSVVKEEIYRNEIENKYNVLAVFDDRDRVVAKWRELGLPTYQNWYGNF